MASDLTPEELAELRTLAAGEWGRVIIAGRKLRWLLDMAERCADYDRRLGSVMPADFKDWHDNLPREWPEVAAGTITNLRQREDWAMEQLERALERLGEAERDLNSNGEA